MENTYGVSEWEFKYNVLANLYTAKLEYNRDHASSIVLSYNKTALLQIINYTTGDIEHEVMGPDDSFPPDYILNQYGKSILKEDGKFGYGEIFTSKDFIYGLYSGKTMNEDISSFEQLLQFDWAGKPIRKLLLKPAVYSFTIDVENNKIYGVNFTDKPLVVFDLPK